jgi:thiol-disulfide isomerase/thioredoxin
MEPVIKQTKSRPGKIIPLILIGLGLVIIGLVSATLLIQKDPGDEYSVIPSAVNFPAPKLVFNDLKGNKVNISDYRDQIVMINNWATWCPPCKAEMPTLSNYYQAHADQGFILFGIEAGDPKEAVANFVETYGLTFPVLLDPNSKALSLFHTDSLPSSYVIDHDGNVILAWTGPISGEMLEKYLTPLLEQ